MTNELKLIEVLKKIVSYEDSQTLLMDTKDINSAISNIKALVEIESLPNGLKRLTPTGFYKDKKCYLVTRESMLIVTMQEKIKNFIKNHLKNTKIGYDYLSAIKENDININLMLDLLLDKREEGLEHSELDERIIRTIETMKNPSIPQIANRLKEPKPQIGERIKIMMKYDKVRRITDIPKRGRSCYRYILNK